MPPPLRIFKNSETKADIIISIEIFKSSPEIRNKRRIPNTISIYHLYRVIIYEKGKRRLNHLCCTPENNTMVVCQLYCNKALKKNRQKT